MRHLLGIDSTEKIDRLLLQEIAEQLECDRNTVTKALRYAYEREAQTAPDGRSRRQTLTRKCSKPYSRRRRRGADESEDPRPCG